MSSLDWGITLLSIFIMAGIGVYFTRRAGRSLEDYFISGRNLPWWVIGLSAVATYTDAGLAPAVTMWVYEGGLLGNAVWWIPYVIWMPLCAVLWSKYWRRLGTVTTAELIEVRYSGRVAQLYRSLYALFLSLGYVVVLMGYVSGWLEAALGPILGWSSLKLILVLGLVTAIYTMLGGLYGVAYSDAAQFVWFLASNLLLVPLVVAGAGGWEMVSQRVRTIRGDDFFTLTLPSEQLPPLTILAFVIQGLFFAASPTGGEGFTAQRFMAAKNEFHAQTGQLFNAVLTIIIRVVPFLFLGIAAAAVIAQGTLAEPAQAWAHLVNQYAPRGVVGIVVAGILAAYMSTISTEMNWGASYLVNDVYKRLLKPTASPRHYVLAGRVASLLLFAASLVVAYFFVKGMKAWFLFINSVVFAFLLPLGWLRFFWWRLNIYGEAAALILGLPLGYVVWFPLEFASRPFWQGFLLLFGLGLAMIVAVTYLTPPERIETLREFYARCRPPGRWGPVTKDFDPEVRRAIRAETFTDLIDGGLGILFATAMLVSIVSPFGGHWRPFGGALVIALASGSLLLGRWARRGVFRSLAPGFAGGVVARVERWQTEFDGSADRQRNRS